MSSNLYHAPPDPCTKKRNETYQRGVVAPRDIYIHINMYVYVYIYIYIYIYEFIDITIETGVFELEPRTARTLMKGNAQSQ